MLTEYQQAILAEPPIVLGKQLLPFSVGHIFLLEAIGSPFAGGGQVTLPDVLTFVSICCRNFSEGKAWLQRIDSPATLQEFVDWGKELGQLNLQESANIIGGYIKQFSSRPAFWRSKDNVKSKLHESLLLVTTLCSKCGFTKEQAWDCGYGEAVWYCVAVNGAEDRCQSDEEIAALNYLRSVSHG